MTLINGYTPEQLEAQYNARAARPDYDGQVVPGWQARSLQVRQALAHHADLAYGEGERERLDFFPVPGQPQAPVLVYFHGGYWQRGDKSIYSFLAKPFVEQGVAVAVVNYDLCPHVPISHIPGQTRKALHWLWQHAEAFGGDPQRLHVIGHSAGGHIVAMLAATDWPAYAEGLPADLLKSVIPVSALFELNPLRFTSINQGLSLDESLAVQESPLNHPPRSQAPQLIVCGARESREFHRQADTYAGRYAEPGRPIERYTVPASDHFEELDVLADPDSPFFQKVLGLVRGEQPALFDLARLEQLMEAFNTHDLDGVMSAFAEDAQIFLASGRGIEGTCIRGKEAISQAFATRFASAPDLRWSEDVNWLCGNRAVSEWRLRGTTADGQVIDLRGCDLWTFAAGKVVRKDTFYKQVTA